jgi:hypothetical protein
MWTQFMNVQGPMMQGMMSNYIEQSKNLFIQMQEQMQSQTKNMFGTFPFGAPARRRTRRSGTSILPLAGTDWYRQTSAAL